MAFRQVMQRRGQRPCWPQGRTWVEDPGQSLGLDRRAALFRMAADTSVSCQESALPGAGGSMTSQVIEDEQQFYSRAQSYWKRVPPTVDGMLGGYGHISSLDLSSSRKFLQRFLRVGGALGRGFCSRGLRGSA